MNDGREGQRPMEAGYGEDVLRGGEPAGGLVDRSILAPRGREESRVRECGGSSGAAGATEAAVRGARGAFFGARRRCARENLAPAVALGAMLFGVALLGVTAPWSPLHPGETNVAEAQAGGEAPLAEELAQGDEAAPEEDGGGDGGGFSPSVLPDTSEAEESSSESSDGAEEDEPAPEESASTGEQPLPEASPGASQAEEQQPEEAQPEEAPSDAAPPADETLPDSAGTTQYAGTAQYASCDGFADQAGAQGALDAGATELDGDGDGEACEAFFGTGVYGADEPIVFAETGGTAPMDAYLKGAGWLLAGGGAAGLVAVGTRRTLLRDRA